MIILNFYKENVSFVTCVNKFKEPNGNTMDRGAWQATVQGISESYRTKRLTLSLSMITSTNEAKWDRK